MPPDYDLLKVTMPVLLFYGEEDVLVNKLVRKNIFLDLKCVTLLADI